MNFLFFGYRIERLSPVFRQIRETVGWLTSEPMLVYYLKFWKGFFWPGGDLAPTSPVRDDEAQAKTRSEAKSALIRNIPGIQDCNTFY